MLEKSSASSFLISKLAQLFFIKLDNNNYLFWVSQFLPVIRTHDLVGIVDGTKPCPTKYLPSQEGSTLTLNLDYTL